MNLPSRLASLLFCLFSPVSSGLFERDRFSGSKLRQPDDIRKRACRN
jgi:hypothetical protein